MHFQLPLMFVSSDVQLESIYMCIVVAIDLLSGCREPLCLSRGWSGIILYAELSNLTFYWSLLPLTHENTFKPLFDITESL